MLSFDANILLHALNTDSPSHEVAYEWLGAIPMENEVAISEFILAELYCLLRNPAVLKRPLSAADAVEVIESYRNHPRWRLIGFPLDSRTLHDSLWQMARGKHFAFRRLYDARTAYSMTSQGVTELATANVKDFQGFGFSRVWNPLLGDS